MSDGYRHDGGSDVDADPDSAAEVLGERDADADAVTGAGSVTAADAPAHRVDVETATPLTDADTSDPRGGQLAGAHPEAVDRQFDWRGWILVGAIFVSFLVIPGIIVLYPHVGPRFGLTFWDTYLALPLIPAVVLALLAVWATTRP